MSADGRVRSQPGDAAEPIWSDRTLETVSAPLFSALLCSSNALSTAEQRVQRPPPTVVRIQSCRLKQIAICMPLGGGKKQTEAPFFITHLHLSECSSSWAPNVCFHPPTPTPTPHAPAVTVKASQSQSNHSNQCLPPAKPIGKELPKQKAGVRSLPWHAIRRC